MSTNDTGYAPPPGYSPPPGGSAPRPPLRRTTGDDKVAAGVAAGIARTLGIDPILIRVAFVVLTIFGGSGLILYLAGWLFIPEDGHRASSGERFLRDNNALVVAAVAVVAFLVLAPLLLWRMWDGGFGFGGFLLLVLAVSGAIALSRRQSSPGDPAAPQPTEVVPTMEHPTAVLPAGSGDVAPPAPPFGTQPVPPPPPEPAAPRKDRSVLGRLTLGVVLLTTGTLVALDLAGVTSVGAVGILSVALAVVGVGLLVGAFLGRSRGLIALGVVLVLVLAPLSAIPDGIRWNTGEGTGERTYRIKTVDDLQSEYRLGAGSLTLDLRDLRAPETFTAYPVDASVGVGELVVRLPADFRVDITSDVGVGVIDMPAEPERDGVDVTQSWSTPDDPQTPTTGSIDLTLSTGIGAVTVIEADPTDQTRELSR